MNFETIFKKLFFMFFIVFIFFFAAILKSEEPTPETFSEKEEIAVIEAETEEEASVEEPSATPSEVAPEQAEAESTQNIVLDVTQPQKAIQLPMFGKITLQASKDPATGMPVLTGRPEKESFNLGLVQITNPEFRYHAESGLQLEANFLFLQQKVGTFAIEKINLPDEILFSFKLPKPIKIFLSPWTIVEVASLNLSLSPTEKQVYAQVAIPAAPDEVIQLSFGMRAMDDAKSVFIQCDIPKLSLASLVPPMKNTPFNALTISNTTLNIQNPFSAATRIINVEGTINFGDITQSLPVKVSELAFTATMGKQTGLQLDAQLESTLPIIPSLLELKTPRFALHQEFVEEEEEEKLQKNTTLTLAGDIDLTLPNIGTLKTKLSTEFKNKRFEEFRGIIDKPFAFSKEIVLQNVQVVVRKNQFLLVGDLDLLFVVGAVKIIDATILGKISIAKVEGKTKLSFSGELVTQVPLRPFALLPGVKQIKEIRDISISNLKVELDSSGELFFSGSSTILGLTTSAKVIKIRNGITLKAWPEGAFDVSKIIPGLKGSPMEKLDFSGLIFAISSTDYDDPEIHLTLPRGISFIIRSKLDTGPLAGLAKLVGPKSLNIVGTFGARLEDLALYVAAPSAIRIPDPIKPKNTLATLENLVLSIKGKGPSVSGKVRIRAQLPMSKQEAVFAGELGIELSDPISIYLKGSMVGVWNNPLGIKGLSLGDLGFELGLGYSEELATTLAAALGAVTIGVGAAAQPLLGFHPSRIAYTGYLGVGSRSIRVATKITDNLDVVLLGEFKGSLATTDLVAFAAKLGAKIPLDKLIDLEVKDSTFKIAFGDTSIGDIKFSPGVTIKGQLIIKGAGGIDFPDQTALVDISVSSNGISAAGCLPRFKLGNLLEITGAGLDQKWGTADDGPAFKLALTPTEQMLYLSGETLFLGNHSVIEVDISPKKAYFHTLQEIQKLFKIEWNGESVGSGKNLDFRIEGNLTNEIQFSFSKEDLIHSIQTLEKERVKAVKKRDNELAAIDKKIAARDAELKKTNAVYRAITTKFEKSTQQLKAQEEGVKKLNGEIKKLQKELGLVFNDLFLRSPQKIHDQELLFAFNDFRSITLSHAKNLHRPQHLKAPTAPHSLCKHSSLLVANTTTLPDPKPTQSKKNLFAETGEAIKKQTAASAKHIKKGVQQTFSILFNPKKWGFAAKLNGLISARNAALVTLGTLKFANERIRESMQMLDPEISRLFRLRSGIWFKHLPELAKWEAAKAFVQGAINSYPAIKWLTPVAIRKLKLNANLRKLLPPNFGLPDINCTINAFGIENTIVVKNANIKDLPTLIKDLAITFVKQFQESILGVKTPIQPPDLPVLEKLKQGTLFAIKSLAWNKYLRIEDGKYLKATGTDKNDPLCQFSILRQGNFLGFKSLAVKNHNLQAVPAKHPHEYQVRFESSHFGLWEFWILNPENPESLDVVRLQNNSGGWLSVHNPSKNDWSRGRVWTASEMVKKTKIPAKPGDLERLAIEIIPLPTQEDSA